MKRIFALSRKGKILAIPATAILCCLLATATVALPVAAADATPTGETTAESATATETSSTAPDGSISTQKPSQTQGTATAAAKPVVSYGLRVLSNREEMVFSGLCGNEVTFTATDICRAMNLSEFSYITISALPASAKGTLFVGSTGAAVGQTISAGSLHLVSFAAADDTKPCDATFRFTVNGGGYDMTCRVCLLENVNYTPTVSLAPAVSLSVSTYKGMPYTGVMSAYDPEGDEITFEVVRYAEHGRISLPDKHTGAYTYTPDTGFTGQDAFSYVVRDAYGNYSTACTVTISVSDPPASVMFADIDGLTCAADALRISAAGLMNGTRVGTECYFKPTEGITRAEFLVTAMNAAGITAEDVADLSVTTFADNEDIPASMRGYVALAVKRGHITGKTVDGKLCFLPDEVISRAEAAVLLSNVIGYAKQTAVTAFADADQVPAWSMQALTSLRSLGVLVTTDGNAEARGTMTRGETAAWLCRTMQLMQG